MEAYTLNLRERIVAAWEEGSRTRQEIADDFGVSACFIRNLMRQWRRTGSLAPKPRSGGRKPALDEQGRQVLRELVEQQPDATLAELKKRIRGRVGRSVSRSALSRHLQALNLPRKKSRCTPASAIRRGCRNYDGSFSKRWPRSRRESWYLWTKAAPPRA